MFCCNGNIPHHQQRLNAINQDLKRIHTPAPVISTIIQQLMHFYHPLAQQAQNLPPHQMFIDTQNEIGWSNFIRGRVAHNINHIVSQYYNQHKAPQGFAVQTWKKN